MDYVSALEIASAVAGRQNVSQTISDMQTLYPLIAQAAAGKLDLQALLTGTTLRADIAALKRTFTVLDAILADPAQGPQLVTLIKSLT